MKKRASQVEGKEREKRDLERGGNRQRG